MGQQQSKDELLYRQVNYGNTEGIKGLHREGAGLEYLDREGKTPLIAACLNPALYNVAKTLIELGANVNAYRPGRYGGTPLHHAAKRGLEPTVRLLLSHGANALLMNDDCQTPLEVASGKGYTNVVRTIESHICLYSGWLREFYGPGFLEVLVPQLLSRKLWVVVLPCGSRNMKKPFKLELAIYASTQDAQPRTTIALWKASMEEPAFNQPDPAVTIYDTFTKTRIKLAPVDGSDKQQLQQFCCACKGIPQVMHPTFPFNTFTPAVPATAPPATGEDMDLAMPINASLYSPSEEFIHLDNTQAMTGASSSASLFGFVSTANQTEPPSTKASCTEQPIEEAGPSSTLATSSDNTQATMPTPSAPTIPNRNNDQLDGPIHYPTIETNPVDISTLVIQKDHSTEDGSNRGGTSSCVICFDAPVEGACVPCGHMAGCISCLNEIKAKNWGCPVCRTKIDQVIKVYAV